MIRGDDKGVCGTGTEYRKTAQHRESELWDIFLFLSCLRIPSSLAFFRGGGGSPSSPHEIILVLCGLLLLARSVVSSHLPSVTYRSPPSQTKHQPIRSTECGGGRYPQFS